MEPSGHPESVQTRIKNDLIPLPPGVILGILERFGINLVPIWCDLGGLGLFFGAISWHLRLALAWFGIILRPFLSKLVWPESGHDFTRGFRQSLVVFNRASWYLIKLLGNLVFRKSSWVFHKRFLHIA